VRAFERAGRHVVTTAIEHPAVLNACAQLEREGVKVTYLLPDGNGIVRAEDVKRVLRPDTVLVSVMHANNEVGTLQRLGEIAQVTRAAGVCFHSDGVQAVGKVPVDVDTLGVDLYTLTAHKFYGPKGVGALYVRKGTNLAPTSFGGHHERDRRAGTENVPAAVALGRAAQWVTENLAEEAARLGVLRDRLEADILARVAECGVNAAGAPRTPNTSSIWFDHIEGEALLIALDLSGFAVSSGAACSSGAVTPSHVLTAIGLPAQRARATIRFSLGRANTAADVDALVEAVAGEVARLRKLSPVAQAR
jgi:cysteine desulfurase